MSGLRGEMRLDAGDGCWLRGVAGTTAAVLLLTLGNGCRRGEQSRPRSDDAAYAAEAGLEFGKDELARVCGSPEALLTLRRTAGESFVPLPGYEQAISEIYGYRLPGGATVAITVRVSESSPNAFALRSRGHSPVEDKTADATVTCEQVQGRKRPS